MAFRPSKHPKKWPKTTKIIKQNEQGVAAEIKMKTRGISEGETEVVTTRAFLKAAEPALKSLRPIPDKLNELGRDLKKLNADYAATVAKLLALESQIEDESDEKKKKKLISDHKKAESEADDFDNRVNTLIGTLKALVQEGNDYITILNS